MGIIREKTNKAFDDYASGKISLSKFAKRVSKIGNYSIKNIRNIGISINEKFNY